MRSSVQRRSLLVKLGAIGDCIMLIPAAFALQQKGAGETLSGAQVEWVCGTTIAPLLALYPWIRPIPIDERSFIRGSMLDRVRCLGRLWPQLARMTYDLVATLYYDPRYRLLTLPTRARRRLQLSHTARAFRLLPGRHHTDEFARILLDLPDDVRSTSLAPVPPPFLPGSPFPRQNQQRRIVLVPGGARNHLRDDALRRWPIENYVALARAFVASGDEVILSGGPEDVWVLPFFASLAVKDLLGRLSLVETLGLFADADLLVTHDTGPLHLAGLTSTPLLALFGPTDPHGRLPNRPGSLAVWGGERFACRPCYDGQNYAACHRNACIEQITPDLAFQASAFLLANRREPPSVISASHAPNSVGGVRPSSERNLCRVTYDS